MQNTHDKYMDAYIHACVEVEVNKLLVRADVLDRAFTAFVPHPPFRCGER